MLKALKKERAAEKAILKDDPAKLADANHNLSDKHQTSAKEQKKQLEQLIVAAREPLRTTCCLKWSSNLKTL